MKKRRTPKFLLFLVFVIYLAFLVYLLFFEHGLRPLNDAGEEGVFSESHLYYCNLTPFKTIREYEKLLKNGRLVGLSLINLLGNLFAFAPQGFFLPLLFPKKYSNFIRFFIFELILISAVEIIQFLTYRGSLDIDDLILNLSGACLFFVVTELFVFINKRRKRRENP
ncbi:MAG: VanZ family protein [Clostridia bacterium]|nr:VanZ family protein [Clostridia bacterium]